MFAPLDSAFNRGICSDYKNALDGSRFIHLTRHTLQSRSHSALIFINQRSISWIPNIMLHLGKSVGKFKHTNLRRRHRLQTNQWFGNEIRKRQCLTVRKFKDSHRVIIFYQCPISSSVGTVLVFCLGWSSDMSFYILFKINVAKDGKRHLHATQLTKPCT